MVLRSCCSPVVGWDVRVDDVERLTLSCRLRFTKLLVSSVEVEVEVIELRRFLIQRIMYQRALPLRQLDLHRFAVNAREDLFGLENMVDANLRQHDCCNQLGIMNFRNIEPRKF